MTNDDRPIRNLFRLGRFQIVPAYELAHWLGMDVGTLRNHVNAITSEKMRTEGNVRPFPVPPREKTNKFGRLEWFAGALQDYFASQLRLAPDKRNKVFVFSFPMNNGPDGPADALALGLPGPKDED